MGWAKWPMITKHAVDFEFNDEVGERSGSYKGGVIGSSENIMPGETPVQAIQRMEAEREFR